MGNLTYEGEHTMSTNNKTQNNTTKDNTTKSEPRPVRKPLPQSNTVGVRKEIFNLNITKEKKRED